MTLINNCQNSKHEIRESDDLCQGSHLFLVPKEIKLTRLDKEFILTNNKFSCEECLEYLTNKEQAICNEIE